MLSPVTAFDSSVCVARPIMMELAPPASKKKALRNSSSQHTFVDLYTELTPPVNKKYVSKQHCRCRNMTLFHTNRTAEGMASKQLLHASTC
jgi:hypothetical protein